MPSVLLATCAALPDGDEDAAGLEKALRRLDVDARWAVWTDQHVAWDASLVVIRSTWDYAARRVAFLDWVARVPRVTNDAAVVAWNTDKTYLRELADTGLPVVTTTFAEPGQPVELLDGEIVIKPAVGAGSRGVGRFAPDGTDAALAHAAMLHREGRTVLVQPYLAEVDAVGETSLIYVDGRFTHAIRKSALLQEASAYPLRSDKLYVEERIEVRTPTADQLAVGAAALDAIRYRFGAGHLYARVDLLPSDQGPVLVELELTEPSLFLGYAPMESTDRFAAAIAARA